MPVVDGAAQGRGGQSEPFGGGTNRMFNVSTQSMAMDGFHVKDGRSSIENPSFLKDIFLESWQVRQ